MLRIVWCFFLLVCLGGFVHAQMVTTIAGGEMGLLEGPVDTAMFNFPNCLAIDSLGNIYVTDKLNYRIRKINIYTNTVSTFVGSIRGYSDGNTLTARFDEPVGLVFSKKGDLYIADYKNSTIRVFHPSTKSSEHFAGRPLSFGLVDGKEGDVRFKRPSSIIEDGKGYFYISDHENHVIRKASPDGTVITYAGNGTRGSKEGYRTQATFSQPEGLAFDKDGSLLIAEYANHRIRKITPAGDVSTLTGSIAGYRDGPLDQALFRYPAAICLDSVGNMYVSDYGNNCIRKISRDGMVSTIAGGKEGYSDGWGDKAKFHGPNGLQIDKDGNIYVSDVYNNRIRKITFNFTPADVPRVTTQLSKIGYGQWAELEIYGRLNGAHHWAIYEGSCGGDAVKKTVRGKIKLSPFNTTTYYIRGEGEGIKPGSCVAITITVDVPYWRTWWFITMAILMLVLIGYFITLMRFRRAQLKSRAMEFEAKALRAQMNPHFIFNTLNSIRGYIASNESSKADYYLTRFARLIRKTLDNSRNSMTSLQSETAALNDYLELEKMRFAGRFEFTIDIDEHIDAEQLMIPPMLIQPFVENAILHGVMFLKHKVGFIKISFNKKEKVLLCTIEDNGIGRAASEELKNVVQQVHVSHGTKISAERVKIFQQHNKDVKDIKILDIIINDEVVGTRVEITIPYEMGY